MNDDRHPDYYNDDAEYEHYRAVNPDDCECIICGKDKTVCKEDHPNMRFDELWGLVEE